MRPAKLLGSPPTRPLLSALESDPDSSPLTGMVEMIPNSETLRKIQVEHGVTGSFKDRPLADWLQKHNPGEDEYEKVGLKGGGEAGVGCARPCCTAVFPQGLHVHREDSSTVLGGNKHSFLVNWCRQMSRDGSKDCCNLTENIPWYPAGKPLLSSSGRLSLGKGTNFRRTRLSPFWSWILFRSSYALGGRGSSGALQNKS